MKLFELAEQGQLFRFVRERPGPNTYYVEHWIPSRLDRGEHRLVGFWVKSDNCTHGLTVENDDPNIPFKFICVECGSGMGSYE